MSARVDLDAVVVGGGAVGLFLACNLAARGLSFVVLEQQLTPSAHSRAIGIHPPALELLAALGLAEQAVARGVPIRRGVVRGEREVLGELTFSGVSPDYPFVLALPQQQTEALLEARLHELRPGALRRGTRVVGVDSDPTQATVTYQDASGKLCHLHARYLVGADGRRSAVRRLAGITYRGRSYPSRYLMGDFEDTTAYGDAAVIHVPRGGVVESFPLPQGRRRWVAHTPPGHRATPGELCALISTRTGMHVEAGTCSMLSPFRVGRHLASRLVAGRVALVGDAAHEVSPIGGQGMNLGWLDAAALVDALDRLLGGRTSRGNPLADYERQRRWAASVAARQAEVNMFFGQPTHRPASRERLLKAVLAPPLRPLMARLFTMRWL